MNEAVWPENSTNDHLQEGHSLLIIKINEAWAYKEFYGLLFKDKSTLNMIDSRN